MLFALQVRYVIALLIALVAAVAVAAAAAEKVTRRVSGHFESTMLKCFLREKNRSSCKAGLCRWFLPILQRCCSCQALSIKIPSNVKIVYFGISAVS